MALTLSDITFNPLRSVTSHRGLTWSRLILSFNDPESDCFPSVELTLLQTSTPDTTIAAIEREATYRAKTILRAALDVLEKQDVASLVDSQVNRDEGD